MRQALGNKISNRPGGKSVKSFLIFQLRQKLIRYLSKVENCMKKFQMLRSFKQRVLSRKFSEFHAS